MENSIKNMVGFGPGVWADKNPELDVEKYKGGATKLLGIDWNTILCEDCGKFW